MILAVAHENKETPAQEGLTEEMPSILWNHLKAYKVSFLFPPIRHQLHANFTAPVEDGLNRGIKVLDIGCGSGVWTLEMARDFPASKFVGIDSEKRYLPQKNIPENCTFVVANTLKLPFPDNEFDYTFQRTMVLAYSPPEWIKVVAELIRVTKPGGMVELFEWDGIMQRPPQNYLKYQNACKCGYLLFIFLVLIIVPQCRVFSVLHALFPSSF